MGGEAQSHDHTTSTLRTKTRTRATPKPFSDCTNTVSQSPSSPLTVVPSKPKPYFLPRNQLNPTSAAESGSAGPSTPLPPLRSSSHFSGGDENNAAFEIHTVYSRRQTANKRKGREKTVVVPLSSYSADRAVNAGSNECEDEGEWEPCTFPLMKKRRHEEPEQDTSENDLQDYIQCQKAYFNEVDAFELPEEEIGSGNELD